MKILLGNDDILQLFSKIISNISLDTQVNSSITSK